uniref:Proline--tRNA ligase n=1 Tax=uncultured marine group II/III euryarchaeote KM3_28_D12 TaxID=1456431 RepID=A0A075GX07_9EURY|nr:prolyl-tRNA synthetase (PARS, proS) [uncultured marine group II/III euryarchaeote KM3_28_D12]
MGDHGKAKRGIPPKEDFNAWYPAIVEIAELVDKRYPIKGMDVWRPYGWKSMKCIDALTHAEMEATGHDEVRFPLLIPEDLLEKENRLVARLKAARQAGVDPSELRIDEEDAGFTKEVYWVKHAGETDLDVPMFLRPTSETAMYTLFALWVRSHADLPLKTYQIVNTFRYETKQTRSFIRVREIHFFEAHTAHADEDDATRQIEEDLEIVSRLMEAMCLPVMISKRPVWDTFPGAWYTIAIDVLMPNGRTLQVASVHHYRDQWAQAFELTYEAADGEQKYCHQTTYGMSERLLGSVVGTHGDDNGLIFPPSVAPIQVVIIPIAAHASEEVAQTVSGIEKALNEDGYRIKVDDRDLRPGQKYWDWEIKGVPLRLEIGPRDVEQGVAMAARRTGGKSPIPLNEIVSGVNAELAAIHNILSERTSAFRSNSIQTLDSLDSPVEDGMFYEIAFCGSDADAEVLEKATGLTVLGDSLSPFDSERPCIVTGQMTTRRQHLGRMY